MHEDQKQLWLDEAIALGPDETIRSEARDFLQPLLKRCNSKSRKTFWQWLRLTLAKSLDTASLLSWMQESRLRLPIEKAKDGFKYIVNGNVALIEITGGSDHVVWRIPVSRLEWALSLYPVRPKRLPDLESPEKAQIRRLKQKIKREMPFLTPAQRTGLERGIGELEVSHRRAYSPIPRFMLIKYQDGQELEVHRMYVGAGPHDQIDPVDGDFTNFATTRVRVTVESVADGGLAIRRGDRPLTESQEVTVQNLQIINNAEAQKDFEESFLQVKETPQGDIKTSLAVRPNADLGARTGIEGGLVADCGSFDPLTREEKIDAGISGAEILPVDEAAVIRLKWRVPAPHRGTRWGA